MKLATFTEEGDIYHPANSEAVGLSSILSKRYLTKGDLLWIKSKGIRVTYPNGQPIDTSVKA